MTMSTIFTSRKSPKLCPPSPPHTRGRQDETLFYALLAGNPRVIYWACGGHLVLPYITDWWLCLVSVTKKKRFIWKNPLSVFLLTLTKQRVWHSTTNCLYFNYRNSSNSWTYEHVSRPTASKCSGASLRLAPWGPKKVLQSILIKVSR